MINENMQYSAEFFESRASLSAQSASIVIPLLFNYYRPETVVDLGCATGEWLSIFQKLGCKIKGYDGEYIYNNDIKLKIPLDSFEAKDLNKPIFKDGGKSIKYDLAISLEVAEHLDPERAEGFIDDLTNLSDVILFSAAIPLQVGVHHVNCQWQSYWAELFASRGFVQYDCFRPILWNDSRVNVIYRNNMLLYVKELSENPNVCDIHHKIPRISMPALDMIHKDLYLSITNALISLIDDETERNDELLKKYQLLKGRLQDLQRLISIG